MTVQEARLEPVQKPGRSKQDYGTPWEFVHAVEKRFGNLRCDLAASKSNAKAPDHFDEAQDSLRQPWAQHFTYGNLWLNPPFGDLEVWSRKCANESLTRHGLIFLLTPASIGSNWFAQHVHRKAMVLGLAPRLQFEGTTAPYPKDLMLSVYGMGMNGFDVWRWKTAPSKDLPEEDPRQLPLDPGWVDGLPKA